MDGMGKAALLVPAVLLVAGCMTSLRPSYLGKPGLVSSARPDAVYAEEVDPLRAALRGVSVTTVGGVITRRTFLPGDPWQRAIQGPLVRPVAGVVGNTGGGASGTSAYLGFDVGHRWSNGFGADASYRWHEATVNTTNTVFVPPALPPSDPFCVGSPTDILCTGGFVTTGGRSTGSFHRIAVKGTFSPPRRARDRRLNWYVGAGPEFFQTTGFPTNDSGLGLMGEGGLVVPISTRARLRAGGVLHGANVDLGPGNGSWMWVLGGALSLEVDL